MSSAATSAVWKCSRAKGSNLLTLLYLAECTQPDGRDAFPGVPAIAESTRLTERAVRYVLHKLEADGEIVIHHNHEGRTLTTSKGKVFCPTWFIDVRCLCDHAAYLGDAEQEKFSSPDFKEGRHPRAKKKEKISDHDSPKPADANGKTLPDNRNGYSEKPEKSSIAYIGSVRDPSFELEQGPAAPIHTEDGPENPDENIRVITKLAHEVLELYADTADVTDTDVVESVKRRCAVLDIAYRSDVVSKAIDAALFQRRLAGKPSILRGSSGESAFRLESEAS